MIGNSEREPNLNRPVQLITFNQSPSQDLPGNQPNQFAQPSLGLNQSEQLSISNQATPPKGNQRAISNEPEILSIPVQPVSDNSNSQLDQQHNRHDPNFHDPSIEQFSNYSLISGMR